MRILLITAHLPYPPRSGHRLRNFNLVTRIARHHEVWLVSFVDGSGELEGVRQLSKICAGVETVSAGEESAFSRPVDALRYLAAGIPPDLRLYESKELTQKIQQLTDRVNFDIVQIEDSFMALYLETLPVDLQKKAVLTFHDVVFSKYSRIWRLEPKATRKFRTWVYSRLMSQWEPRYTERFGRCIAMSEADCSLLHSANPRLKITVIPNGIDTSFNQLMPFSNSSPELVFVGNMGYRPNVDAMAFFCQEIYPRIIEKIPDLKLWIVGINPSPEVKKLENENVHVTGQVDDVRPYYRRSTVCVVPLRAGGGTRIKILESMALGRPVVTTTIGCEGLDVVDGQHLFIADTPGRFADAVLRLLTDEGLRHRVTKQARELAETRYDWDTIAGDLSCVYEELAAE